jgi:DNA-binding transcriptional LysR family regulator
MNLRQIEAFSAIMLTGSVSQAARHIGVSQPAVSRLIAQLERSLDMSLFSREKGRIRPTAEAVTLHEEVRRAFIGIEKLKQIARDIKTFSRGHLRIASLPALSFGFLPKVIARFNALHPDVTITVQTQSSPLIIEWVAAQQFDLGLASGAADSVAVNHEVFSSTVGVCVMPPGHRLQKKAVIRPKDLDGEPFISLGSDYMPRYAVDAAFEAAKIRRRLLIETPFAATVCGCVLEGLGVSIVNPFTADDFVDRGIVIRPFAPAIPLQTQLLYPAHRPRSRLVSEFVSVLRTVRDECQDRHRRHLARSGAIRQTGTPPRGPGERARR